LAEPEQGRAEELRITADVIIRVWMQLLSVSVSPHFLGLILALGIDRAWVPVVLLAWDIIAALQQQNAFARGRAFVRQRPAARPAADNDDVVTRGLSHGFLLQNRRFSVGQGALGRS